VALWNLIERFNLFGQSELRESTLNHFSQKIRKSKIWLLLNTDIQNDILKENKKFPVFDIKTIALKEKVLTLPRAKFTLIDFWFSRCRPCLDGLPTLKKLYALYQPKGFEIVSISTDLTENVPIWQKRIREYELNWPQYLDENRLKSQELNIYRFPTFILLNRKGEIIKKYLSLKDLEVFLIDNLGK